MSSHSAEHEEGGEGYFASISDLMVGILFVFLLMLAVFAMAYNPNQVEDLEKRIEALEAERDGLRRDVEQRDVALASERARAADLAQRLASARDEILALRAELDRILALVRPEEREAFRTLLSELAAIEWELQSLSEEGRLQRQRRELLVELRRRLELRGIQVELSDQYDVLRLPSEEMFVSNAPDFTPRGSQQAMLMLEELASLLPCYAKGGMPSPTCPAPFPAFEALLIEGHTDIRPTPRPGGNWRLSTDRALALFNLMRPSHGLAGLTNAADQPLIGLAGYGESRRLSGIPGEDPRNRRIELRFLLAAPSGSDMNRLRQRVGDVRARLEALRPQP